MTKTCFKCGRTKPLRMFYKHKQMSDGHLGKCKLCTKRDAANRYRDPAARERIKAYERSRFQDPERKERVREYNRRMRARNRGKYRARNRVWSALKSGIIERQKCEVCGAPDTEAHHTDYRKPLAVVWLCFKHHREEHRQLVRPSK